MDRKVVILYGPPGSGKGTQAELLSRRYDFVNFDTGRYLENLFKSKEALKDPKIKHQKFLFDTGKLTESEWILGRVKNETKKLFSIGANIILSGSPRTMYEAFGDRETAGLMKSLERMYGKKNIHIIYIDVPASASIKRNSARRICSVCGLQVLAKAKRPRCQLCDGATTKRTLDKPEIIKVRLREFKERTFPILSKMKKDKYNLKEIDGRPAPYKVHEKIAAILKLNK